MTFAATAVAIYLVTQIGYFLTMSVVVFLFTRHVDEVDLSAMDGLADEDCPHIVLFYPVLNELEDTMRTTFLGLAQLEYPRERFDVIAIPNTSDIATVERLERLQAEFDFLDILPVPPTSDPAWDLVWDSWEANPHAYWWHQGPSAQNRELPPKKTRQLIFAFYATIDRRGSNWILDYIDADSVPPVHHFKAAAVGLRDYDVLQSTNIAANLLATIPSSFHAMDHMAWDNAIYPHLTARGKQPYWMLGKGLFFRASDLIELGGFHPWLTIEDPEVGMRLWTHGRRLGVIMDPLIEECPATVRQGITQRKRWVCGFLQSTGRPLRDMGMTWRQRVRARLNLVPSLSLCLNPIGVVVGVWALTMYVRSASPVPAWMLPLAVVNVGAFVGIMACIYVTTWRRTGQVLDRWRDRVRFMARVSPPFLAVYWLVWVIPIVIGVEMFLRNKGLVWERTEKVDANHDLVRAMRSTSPSFVPIGATELNAGHAVPTPTRVQPVRVLWAAETTAVDASAAPAPVLSAAESRDVRGRFPRVLWELDTVDLAGAERQEVLWAREYARPDRALERISA